MLAVAAGAALLPILLSASASADSCADLRRELQAARNEAGGTISQIQRYEDAARRQAEEIRKTIAIQEQRGCYRDPDASCQQLAQTLRRMRYNLSAMNRQLNRLKASRNTGRVRAIETRLKAYRCDQRQAIMRNGPERGSPSLVTPDRPASNQVIIRDGTGPARVLGVAPDSNTFDDPNAISVPRLSGTFRTLCVRTCDGYYFPVSFSTTSAFFARDAEACRAMCPATETKLYFHRVPEEESEAMISLQGEPYTALPTAFLYRKRRTDTADPSCTCGKPQATASARPERSSIIEPDAAPAVPTPERKPDDGLADPESQFNAVTGLTRQRIRELTGAVTVGEIRSADSARKVRVVGPEFLPDPKEAIDLKSPGPTAVR
ncbi:MAG: DUF2865 domain-containing protein [Oricola sp.]